MRVVHGQVERGVRDMTLADDDPTDEALHSRQFIGTPDVIIERLRGLAASRRPASPTSAC